MCIIVANCMRESTQLHRRLDTMTRVTAPLVTALAILGAFQSASSFPFKTGIRHDESDLRQSYVHFNAGVDGSEGGLHAFRESADALNSHADFLKGARVPSGELHNVVFVVRQRNLEELKRILYDVSDPLSTNYGNHMTFQEIDELVSNPVAHQEVVAYLSEAGATVIFSESQGECITARAEVGIWERMLNTKFHSYAKVSPSDPTKWPSSAMVFSRSDDYSVPIGLDEHIESIMNTIQIPVTRYQRDFVGDLAPIKHAAKSRFSEASNSYSGWTSPSQIQKRYNVLDASGHPRATQGALEAFGQKYCPTDLLAFQNLYDLPRTPVNYTYGPATYTSAECAAAGYTICIESNIDIQYLLAMADSPTLHYYSTFNTFAQWAQYAANSGVLPPLVISISYGDDEKRVSFGETNLFEVSTLKLGVMGVTVLIASGDDGVNTGQTRVNAALCGYAPQYPTACPYVISVGATQVQAPFIPIPFAPPFSHKM
jgi:tripeptidyl-peptidase I